MIHPKEFYRNYLADNQICELNKRLIQEVLKDNPNHVFEMGCGSGKNLRLIQKMQSIIARSDITVSGLDISLTNILHSYIKNNIQHVSIGDESYLRHYCNYDIVFTCSCLDHIKDIEGIVQELKRISNKAVIIAECYEADEQKYYYAHKFEDYGFEMIEGTKYYSESDGHNYAIYKWLKQPEIIIPRVNDDSAH